MPTSTDPIAISEQAKELLARRLKDATPATQLPPSLSLPRNSQGSLTSLPSQALSSTISKVPLNGTSFVEPKKRIVSPVSLSRFEKSETFAEILTFVETCNTAIVGKALNDDFPVSAAASSILDILEGIKQIRQQTPPDSSNSSSRFGNPAFRTFYAKLRDNNDRLHRMIPGLESEEAEAVRKELSIYLQESWGNEKRIDYGSGMELNFACWLLCLCKLQILNLSQDGPVVVLKIFWGYIQVMRDIQSTYWLEPAGSHGVWGLDDYHFLPFLWGAGQLSNHKYLRPKSIHDAEIMEELAGRFMYFACIQFINSVKTASLQWHSPMLDDISSVKTWSKVNEGMIKMYRAEVLLKLPIAQHMFFGTLLPFPEVQAGEEEETQVEEDSHGHIHPVGKPHGSGEGQAAGWGDCCGIPIPSAFAAAQDEKRKLQESSSVARGEKPFAAGVRRIPFD